MRRGSQQGVGKRSRRGGERTAASESLASCWFQPGESGMTLRVRPASAHQANWRACAWHHCTDGIRQQWHDMQSCSYPEGSSTSRGPYPPGDDQPSVTCGLGLSWVCKHGSTNK